MDRKLNIVSAALIGLALTACSSGGGSSSSQGGLQLTELSVQQGGVWQINREIEFTFNDDIDFRTVSFNTISIQTPDGQPANGTFTVKLEDLDFDGIPETPNPKVIVFQPTCPTLADLSDAGLQVGSVLYEIVVAGQSSGAQSTIRSTTGKTLATTQRRTFITPASSASNVAFLDTVNGPPAPIIRPMGSMEEVASYVEIGGDDNNRVYFEFDSATQTYTTSIPGFQVPLNLYSDADSAVAVVLYFNQPVSPLAVNISSTRLRLEFLDGSSVWQPIDTRVELVENCTDSGGAILRLEPLGVLPAGSSFRASILAGFQDLSGETALISTNNFSNVPTESVAFASLTPASDKADELLEEFAVGGDALDSFEDDNVLFDTSPAEWGGGSLKAGFTFEGTGGPNGDFDVVVGAGEVLLFDTTSSQVIGGPGGIPTTTVTSIGGVLDVRNFTIEPGGTFRVSGPNGFQLNASGNVRIDGLIDASGFPAKDVGTLNTGNQKEIGGKGVAGGGNGGDASTILNNSTPRGDRGQGAFGTSGGGGNGGETGYAPKSMGKNHRRPGGGGGGAFGPRVQRIDGGNVLKTFDGQSGWPGHESARGAESNQAPAAGGVLGPRPFVDPDPSNDFFGIRPYVVGPAVSLVQGELPRQWAGSGGGGGGDAVPNGQFPFPNWTIFSDEKGGGGGGGGGAINIRALGDIVFGAAGEIRAIGGQGAKGENTLFLDHIGGSGGAGSGGHIIVESASVIDFSDGGTNGTPLNKANGYLFINANGGKGGAGSVKGKFYSKGGDGGPGIVQLHVPDPTIKPSQPGADILVPNGAASEADPLQYMSDPPTFAMIPTFGARSKARSKWVSLGGADQDPSGGVDQVSFLFDGTDPMTGSVNRVPGMPLVQELAPILGGGGGDLVGAGNDAVVRAGGAFLDIGNTGSTLDALINDMSVPSKDVYLRSPDLLRNFTLRLTESAAPTNFKDFVITDAVYDDALVTLALEVDVAAGTLEDYVNGIAGSVTFAVIPRFFNISTGGVLDSLSTNADVKIFFEATGVDVFGNPDESNILVPLTTDIADFNAQPAGAIRFYRYQIEFDLDSMGGGLTIDTEPVELEFLRLPFRF